MFYITFTDKKCKSDFFEQCKTFRLENSVFGATSCTPIDIEVKLNFVNKSVFGLPYEIQDEILGAKVGKYAEAESITRPTFKEFSAIQNGVRVVRVKNIQKPRPNKMYIKGIQVYTKYTGQQSGRNCYHCKRSDGHLAAECPYKEAMNNQTNH